MSLRLSSLFPSLRALERGRVTFSRAELSKILNIYSTQVAAGKWRDYAIDHVPGMAIFSIFRHTLDRPFYSIVKCRQSDNRRSHEYAVFQGLTMLRRAPALKDALRVLDRPLKIVKN